MDPQEPRIVALEESVAQVRHDLYGNGKEGVTEVVRRLEATINRHEAARKHDITDATDDLREVTRRLEAIEDQLLVSRGGWRTARILAGILVPVFLGFLTYIAIGLNRLVIGS